MCGICGVVVLGGGPGLPDAALRDGLARMNATLWRRGPDSEGVFVGEGAGLAMRRLAIIDLAGGEQPVSTEDGRTVAVCNGEIYNYRELRAELGARGRRLRGEGDVETIPHLFAERGLAFTEALDGMFALAVWDGAARRLVLARDRMGIKPLYHARVGNLLLFASELKALLAWPGFPRELDPVALAQYLRHEHVPAPRSILSAARKLRAGHQLVVDTAAGTVEERPWWRLELAPDPEFERRPERELADLLWQTLSAAVRREMVSDVPIGVFLSGGLDSTGVAAAMVRAGAGPVRSFSLGFREASFDESGPARRAAAQLGTEHAERTCGVEDLERLVPAVMELLDEPFADASILPTHLLSLFAREHVKVALGGDGGDEMFGGYTTLVAHRLVSWYRRVPRVVRERIVLPLVERLPASSRHASLEFRARRFVRAADLPLPERHHEWMGGFSIAERAAVMTRRLSGALLADPEADALAQHVRRCGRLGELEQALFLDAHVYLESDVLTKVDRASMGCSLEVRVPLLNREVVALAARLPTRLKLRGLTGKHLLRRALRGRVPDETLTRAKHGFGVPVAAWLRTGLKPLALDLLSPSRLESQGLFVPEEVERLLREHLAGERDHRKRLWTLLAFQLWHERWLRSS